MLHIEDPKTFDSMVHNINTRIIIIYLFFFSGGWEGPSSHPRLKIPYHHYTLSLPCHLLSENK